MEILNVDQLGNFIFATVKENLLVAGGPDAFKKFTESWLISKKQNYKGEAYINQLENNSVYFVESAVATIHKIVHYIHDGKPKLKPKKVQAFVDYETRFLTINNIVNPILDYIRGASNQIPFQLSNWRWDKVKAMREANDLSTYVGELEITCLFAQAEVTLARTFLVGIMSDRKCAGIAKTIPNSQVFDTVNARFQFLANFLMRDT
ncbi:MAG: hypothetical protein K8L91_18145 [Anaerolineae bacterium]|nr:hypothetical protein [Anaerolineae bacterium]